MKSMTVAKTKNKLLKKIWKHRYYYLFLLPAIIWLLVFKYAPMYGIQIAFKDYKASLGIIESPWVGLQNFKTFISNHYFWVTIRNTFVISLYSLVVSFPIPIILALVLNELKPKFKKFTQTLVYAPHFISTVVLVGMMTVMFSPSMGVVNTVLDMLGFDKVYFMAEPGAFRHLFVWSGVWQSMGWSAIIYIAALSNVSQELHDAAAIDGASRLQRIIHVNLPCIAGTIIILLIMRVGSIATVGYEKAYLMQNDLNIGVSEVLSTYVYKRGLVNNNYSLSAAADLFDNIINIIMLFIANTVSKKFSDTSLF